MSEFLLKLLQWVIKLFPSLFSSVPAYQATADVLNIFAWARVFVPVDLILSLLLLTASWYVFKFFVAVVKFVINIIK